MVMKIAFEIVGQYPLLMHRDDVLFQDELTLIRKGKEGKDFARGDDRFPAWSWHGALYSDGEYIALPSSAIMASLTAAASRVNKPTRGTYKKDVLGNVAIATEYCAFFAGQSAKDLHQIRIADVAKMKGCDFALQCQKVAALGFELDVRRAKIGQGKHVRVRPRFEMWKCSGDFVLFDPKRLGKEELAAIGAEAGPLGLCDYRPGSPKSPGPFGRFELKLR